MDNNITLSPPWYTLRNELAYTIGAAYNVSVSELVETCGCYALVISIKGNSQLAQHLREIIPAEYIFGDVIVTALIYDAHTNTFVPKTEISYNSVEELAEVFYGALTNNPYFKGLSIVTDEQPPTLGNLVVIIDKCVIQFFNDDISDLYGNYNAVAAQTFSNILEKSFPPNYQVTVSTYDCTK